MTRNSKIFGNFVRDSRERRGWGHEHVYETTSVPVETQDHIERGDPGVEVSDTWLHAYNHIFEWPHGYASVLADMGRHPTKTEALRGSDRDVELSTALRYFTPQTDDVWKTFSGLYDRQRSWTAPPFVGFDVITGDPVSLEGPTLTNVSVEFLHAMMLARHGHTSIDVNVMSWVAAHTITTHYGDEHYADAPLGQFELYTTGTLMDREHGKRIGLDPLIGLRSLTMAKSLAASLLELRPETPTTVMRAGLTFFAAASLDDQPLQTLIQLKRAQRQGSLSQAGEQRIKDFYAHWDEHFLPRDLGWELAQPDPAAADLLAGLVNARDALVGMDTHSTSRGLLSNKVEVVGPEKLLDRSGPGTRSAILYYDSSVSPELPAALQHEMPTAALTFFAATTDRPRLGAQHQYMSGAELLYPVYSVGITTENDCDVIAQHSSYNLSTLTHYHEGQAIYCDGEGARRVWIPRL
ncbi:hypothetical protein BTO20_37595 (plasmid) [Mycobacterium dioxanotrophicus]|jgi:hypothetical protein|uniref:Uncharacterized protein n=1 Tax=Mycobacterium dioxanotrophicus TaxID=482462 RepID=A0A1Y0CGF6_9MYCO|nr:hypothetical protein [Mycobacterium dioxanotrophicus]ART74340.1 hypothetical protein BTO20_37595 [Mycobacterium dioxanotrophicus]